jgi:hypothetical protein
LTPAASVIEFFTIAINSVLLKARVFVTVGCLKQSLIFVGVTKPSGTPL